ncbi:uncharacterized protein TRIADDRAFT_26083 [Trichoplax adhaerens]|uniref:Uncharacterized protein n=1 Tax=Trichoplax adhaerens TaxID=10228 RepID=B3RWL1_TRIAD|nr:hypothetical protein TRIADDRAFT_26083 [Trichoplax adhaerens]EDV25155.1 hypothetical protein TRIADDRAFT_26083 [Trichoplax adhaerens]|eukprot:XP_002113045.1 hypothetical protein TRIADDRAFT_26083 [Trichoplax adhaerens]
MKGSKRNAIVDEEIPSDDEEIQASTHRSDEHSEDEYDSETAEDKRLRLAKEYLRHLEQEELQDQQSKDTAHDAIAHRLKEEFLDHSGKQQKLLCDECIEPDPDKIIKLQGHKLSVTCVAFSHDGKFVYSGSKDSSIIKWDLETFKKVKVFHGFHKAGEGKGHKGHILCLDVSLDCKYMASGGQDKLVYLWDLEKEEVCYIFKGHKDIITGLRFRHNSHELYSTSKDRSVKVWSVDERAYVETLFGHQDAVLGIDCLRRQRPVTAGGRDCSIHVWKIIDESYLKFETNKRGSMECLCMLNEDNYLSGTDDGSLITWNIHKKRPTFTRDNAHGSNPQRNLPTDDSWIISVASVPYSDLAISGSNDNQLRLWRSSRDYTTLSPLFSVDVPGFINGLALSHNGQFIACAIGQEHKLGRWWHLQHVKNCVCIIDLRNA